MNRAKTTFLRNLIFIISLILSLSLLISCQGPVGPAGENGNDGAQGEQGAQGAQGPQGIPGESGTPGTQVTIGEDGYWYLDGQKTDVPAVGTPGADGTVLTIGENGNWFINGEDSGIFAGVVAERAFVPVLRFAVASDFHVREDAANDYGSRAQLTEFLKSAKSYSRAQEDYGQLDGVFFVGDLTQAGTENELKEFFSIVNANTEEETISLAVLGNHDFLASDDRFSDASVQSTYHRFMQASGYESVDTHVVINGYHFILVSMDRYDKQNSVFFSDEKLAWLDDALTAAAYDDPTRTKPIFVFQHVPPQDTMYGSTPDSADANLTELLSHYPQVVDFSGHTHYPVTDPRAIWQDSFTALTTGSMSYYCVPIAGHPTKDQSCVIATDDIGSWISEGHTTSQIRNAHMYYMVEVDKSHQVRIRVCDTQTDAAWGEPMVFPVGNADEFIYTEDRGNVSLRPIWQENTEASVINNYYKKVQIEIPQAIAPEIVQNYRVDVYDSENALVKSAYSLACTYYGQSTPDRIRVSITGLCADSTYTCKIYAVNSWGRVSAPKILTLTTSAAQDVSEYPTPDVLQARFEADGSAVNAITGESLAAWGTPRVEDGAAAFDGSSAYILTGMPYWYDVIERSFTLETYVYLPQKPTASYVDLISNQQSGGFGLEYKKDGKVYLYANVGESADNRPSAVVPVGEWAHLVGTYDGLALCLYLNGELVSSASVQGSMKTPMPDSQYLVIGGDSSVHGPSNFAVCSISVANLYSDALSAEQISLLYQRVVHNAK